MKSAYLLSSFFLSIGLTPFQFAFADPKGERRTEGEYEIAFGGSQKAAQVSTVEFETPIVAPRYEHVAPVLTFHSENKK